MLNQRSDKVELLRIAEAVATEKSIDKEIILNSMELAIQKAAKTKFGSENDIRAKIDRESGDITLHKVLKVVESADNFDLSPRGIREMLALNQPIYECTSAYGHFGRKPGKNGSFSWEKTDKRDIFNK